MKYRARLFRVALLLAVICVIVLFTADLVCQSAAKGRIFRALSEVPENKVALVLGTAKFTAQGRPNLHFRQRIDAAAALFHARKVEHLLVSGDNGSKDYDEPSDMRDALVAAGVPSEAITCDYAGFRTLDSVVRAKEIFKLSQFTIVSEEFHCQRALWIARKHDVDAIAFAAADLNFRWSARVKVREILARTLCGIDLYILQRGPRYLGAEEPIMVSANK